MPQIPSPLILPQGAQKRQSPLEQLLMSLAGTAGTQLAAGGIQQLFEPSLEDIEARNLAASRGETAGRLQAETTETGQTALAQIESQPGGAEFILNRFPEIVVARTQDTPETREQLRRIHAAAPLALQDFEVENAIRTLNENLQNRPGGIAETTAFIEGLIATGADEESPEIQFAQKNLEQLEFERQQAELEIRMSRDPTNVNLQSMRETIKGQILTQAEEEFQIGTIGAYKMLNEMPLDEIRDQAAAGGTDALVAFRALQLAGMERTIDAIVNADLYTEQQTAVVRATMYEELLAQNWDEWAIFNITSADVKTFMEQGVNALPEAKREPFERKRTELARQAMLAERAALSSVIDTDTGAKLILQGAVDARNTGDMDEAARIYNEEFLAYMYHYYPDLADMMPRLPTVLEEPAWFAFWAKPKEVFGFPTGGIDNELTPRNTPADNMGAAVRRGAEDIDAWIEQLEADVTVWQGGNTPVDREGLAAAQEALDNARRIKEGIESRRGQVLSERRRGTWDPLTRREEARTGVTSGGRPITGAEVLEQFQQFVGPGGPFQPGAPRRQSRRR